MNNTRLDDLLKQQLSIENTGADTPPLDFHRKARLLVSSRRGAAHETEHDLLAMLAAFLNLRIRLFHAVIATLVIWVAVLFFTREDNRGGNASPVYEPVSSLAATQNTVLSSIQTCVRK